METGMAVRRNENDEFPRLDLDIGIVDLPHCRYLDIVNCSSYNWSNNISILLCNIRSCRRNFLDFTSYFNDVLFNYSCIILIETWLSNECENVFRINGYRFIDLYRNNYGGGIRLYTKETLNVNVLQEYFLITDVTEMIVTEISTLGNKFLLCCVYHPPTSDHGLNYEFIDQFKDKLASLRSLGIPIVVGGDFNLNLFNPLNLNYISYFVNTMLDSGLCPLINIPTKVNPDNRITKCALLDQIWISNPSLATDSYVVPFELTDHFPVAVQLSFQYFNQVINIPSRIFNHQNNMKFTRLLENCMPLIGNDEVDATFNAYYEKIFQGYCASYPLREIIPSSTNDNEWMTPPVKQCIKKKSKLYRMFTRGYIYKEDYTYYANRLTVLLNKVRKLYYYKLFLRCGNNTNKTWLHINHLIGNRSKSTMEKLLVEGEIKKGTDMVEYANGYFANVANALTVNLAHVPFHYYRETNPHTFSLRPTDIHEVIKVIMSLKNNGNSITDISIKTVKNNSHIFSIHVVVLYNFSIEKYTYPNKLKIARVAPAHKAGSRHLIDNYRPISNLPLFSKIFEKLTHIRVMSFVEQHKLLCDSQFGFQKGKSITHAALKLTTMIVGAYHQKQYCACFYLDLKKAFDTLDHDILIKKLDLLGFRGHSNNFFKSYIENRKQYVHIKEFKSSEHLISKGVPQGSVLGPIFFCLYIDDIVKAVDVEAVLFADDAAFFVNAFSLQELYDKIKKLFADIQEYLCVNKLIPNKGKSKLMYFNSRPVPRLKDIYFSDHKIEWVDSFKYLGLTLTSKMSFAEHIDNAVNRISRFSGIFYNLKFILPVSILKMLFRSFVMPHLLLHIEIWGSAPCVHMNKLDIKVNNLLRIMLGVRYVEGRPMMDTSDMYNRLGLLRLKNIYRLRMFRLLASLLKGYFPEFYDLFLRPYLSAHNYGTRGNAFRHPLVVCGVEQRGVSSQLISL